MRQPVFNGVCPALVTPFTETGAVNYDALAALIERQLQAGVDAVCICGTTGETPTLSIREQIALISFCVKQVSGRVKVIAGAGSNDTHTALYLSQHAQDAGADALLLVTPYYNKTTQAGLVAHYETIAQKVNVPIILYNVPGRTGLSFAAETYQRLAQNPIINGVKEASGDFALLAHTRAVCPDDFYIWSGNDDLVVPMMALGARGVISVAANLVPEVMTELAGLCLEDRFTEAAALQIRYVELFDALFDEVNPIPIKAALKLSGLDVGTPRPPLCELSSRTMERLRLAMEKTGCVLAGAAPSKCST